VVAERRRPRRGGSRENFFVGVWVTESESIQRYEVFDVGAADQALIASEPPGRSTSLAFGPVVSI
jgi:hypothetical protein